MSRVPADTVLLRLALAAAIALPLSGCGGDDAETASTPVAPVATTAAPAAAGASTPDSAAPTSGPKAISVPGADDPDAEATDEAFQETKKAAEAAAETASPAKQSNDELAQQMKVAYDALNDAGLSPGKPIASAEDSGALTIQDTTVAFFLSPRAAAAAGAALESAFKASPQHVKVARKANRLFLLSLPQKPTDAQLETYRKVRKVVNGAV